MLLATSCWCAKPLTTKSSKLKITLQALKNKFREPVIQWVVGSFVVACVAATPLFVSNGFLNTRAAGDSPFLLFRLHQLYQGLLDGVFPVRWMPDATFGLGYPFFNFYAALPFYFAAIFKLIGFSYVFSLKLTHLLGFIVAAIGTGAFAWRLSKQADVAFISAAAYTFAPFHIVNVYLRGDSLSEFWAMAWYPLILLTIHRAVERLTWQRMAWVALIFSALVMTHNVSALLFSPFIAVYSIGSAAFAARKHQSVQFVKQHQVNAVLVLTLAGVLGLALAAWFWLPALLETEFVQLDDQTTGYFAYDNHFRSSDLVQRDLVFNYTFGRDTFSPFSLGAVQAVLTGLGALMLCRAAFRRTALRWQAGFILLSLLASMMMITPLSNIVWANVPLLPLAQFPWRFLSIVSLFSSLTIGFILPESLRPPLRLADEATKREALSIEWTRFAAVALAIILAVSTLSGLDLNFINIRDTDVTAERLRIYEAYSGNIGTTIRFEYLPRWVQPRPYASDILLGRVPNPKFTSGSGSGERLNATTHAQQWAFTIDEGPALVTIPLLYFPGWAAEINGEPIDISPAQGLGSIQFELPEGQHSVDLSFGRTPIRQGAEGLSLAALLVVFYTLRPQQLKVAGAHIQVVGLGLTGLILMMVLLRVVKPSTDETILLSADFSQEAYHHLGPVRFFAHPDLIEARFTTNGDQLAYQLIWATLPQNDELNISLSLTAAPQQTQQGAPSLRLSEQMLTNRTVEGEVALEAVTPGIYFPWLEVSIAGDTPLPITLNALTAGGQTRGDVVLTPLIVLPKEQLSTSPSATGLNFGPVQLVDHTITDDYERLNIQLIWQTETELMRNYAVAFRLRDANGFVWGELDTQAGGAGLYPTSLWRVGETVFDNYQLTLARAAPPTNNYQLEVTLYDAETLEPVGQTILKNVAYRFVSRASCQESASAALFAGLRVRSAAAQFDTGQLNSEVEWTICEELAEDYRLRWQIAGEQGEALWQIETPLMAASQPTSWALQDDFGGTILGRYRFDGLPTLPQGTYQLSLTLLSERGAELATYDVGDVSLDSITRRFEIPSLENGRAGSYADIIQLAAYQVTQSSEAVELTVAWRALQVPEQDYQYFIHLFDPTTERIVAQLDSMPRAFTYPTSRWVQDEVIEEEIVLPLAGVPPGDYQVAVGWYTLADGIRLSTVDAALESLPDNRIVLSEMISVR